MNKHKQLGFFDPITLLVVFLIALVIGAAGGPTSSNNRSAENTARAVDAASLLAATVEFESNNQGRVPTAYKDGALTGQSSDTPTSVALSHYKTVVVKTGKQAALKTDELWLVPGSTCDGDGAVVGIARSDAVLYSKDTGDGFTGLCKNL